MYIHTDGLGSPVARTNDKGQLISRTRYEPYGATAAGATPTIGFTGHVNDPDTGLVYMQQRYYDPYAGRFLSTDPVLTDANTGKSFNRYVYASNNPFKYIDPDGSSDVCSGLSRMNCETFGSTGNSSKKDDHVGTLNPNATTGFVGSTDVQSGDDDTSWGNSLPGTTTGASSAQYWANLHVKTGNPLYGIPGAFASLWTPDTAGTTAVTLATAGTGALAVRGVNAFKAGAEITIGKNFRLAIWGNRTGHATGRFPHYHRRVFKNVKKGKVKDGQGIGRHRPWDKDKNYDKSFWDRF